MAPAVSQEVSLAEWSYTGNDYCCQFFTTALAAFAPPIPPDASVLEIGCAELDWIALARKTWPQMSITGIDMRKTKQSGVIHGDVLTHGFTEASFDWIVSISAIEHIGLGHYQDPKHVDGDTVAMERAYRWLKPGGWMYFDVPWNAGIDAYQVVGTSHRVYDDERILLRLRRDPWRQAWSGVVKKQHTDRLVTHPPRIRGGDDFYYCGFWWQKPSVD